MGSKEKIVTQPILIVFLAISGGAAAWSFAGIVRGYRRRAGVPWAASIAFAAAAAAAVLVLHALVAP
jgi:hypothetical protein